MAKKKTSKKAPTTEEDPDWYYGFEEWWKSKFKL